MSFFSVIRTALGRLGGTTWVAPPGYTFYVPARIATFNAPLATATFSESRVATFTAPARTATFYAESE
jgi:hypothetical protein